MMVHWVQLWALLLPPEQRDTMATGCNQLVMVAQDILSLKEELKKVLNGKLFLLILDDIWFGNDKDKASDETDEKLKEILIPLVDGKRKSKILVTSRQNSLLRLGRTVKSTTYKIPDLDGAVFFKLFMQYAFDENRIKKEDERRIKQIGAEIALKLKKSPLLARVVGSFLFQKRKIEVADWISVRNQNLIDKNMGALWWTYQHLCEQARRCFAYCSIFSRRYFLRRDELVNLWVAEGFIDSTNIGHEMEYVGRGYFNELLSSSFLLPGGKDYDGEEYFLIHDLLYDLAVKAAGDDSVKIDNSWTSEVPVNVRHLSIQSCTASMVSEHIVKLKKLRTLIIYKFDKDFLSIERYGHLKFNDAKGLDNMFCQLSELRVLIFGTDTYSNAYLNFALPKSIGFLKCLRYLGIQRNIGNQVITLPDTVKKLHLLQVLDLGTTPRVHSSFGADLTKLADLRRVYSNRAGCFPNMGRLTSLRTMPTLDVSEGKGYELYQLEHLNNLEGKLIIHGLGWVKSKDEALNAKLADKKLLTELELSWFGGVDIDLEAEVLEALCPPENITYLRFDDYHCSRYPTWMVGTKESTIQLSQLVLNSCPRPVCGPEHFFITVSSLVLEYCQWDTLPDMKHLTSLNLWNCSTPSSLENLTSLERLIIDNCYDFTVPPLPRSLLYIDIDGYSCIKSKDQIFDKVKHIPHIKLSDKAFKDGVLLNDDKEEDYEGVDEEDDDEGASQVNGSQTSAQVQANTRQLVKLIEAQEDSVEMSITSDDPLMVDTSLHLAVGSEGRQSRRTQDLDLSESLQLPLARLLASAPSSIHLTLAPCSSPDTAHLGELVDPSQAPSQLNHEEFPELSEDVEATSINCSRQLIQLIEEVRQDSGVMSINTDVPQMVDTSLHLAVASEGQIEDLESLHLPSTSLLAPSPSSLHQTLAVCSSPDRSGPVGNFHVDINNDLSVQRGNNGMLVNAVGQYHDLNQDPPAPLLDLNPQARLVDLNQAPQDEATNTNSSS